MVRIADKFLRVVVVVRATAAPAAAGGDVLAGAVAACDRASHPAASGVPGGVNHAGLRAGAILQTALTAARRAGEGADGTAAGRHRVGPCGRAGGHADQCTECNVGSAPKEAAARRFAR